MQKTGFFKICRESGQSYLSYAEFYARSDTYKNMLRDSVSCGETKLYCACREDEELELFITKANVVRVKVNGQQHRHRDSCPKSEVYSIWLKEHQAGASYTEDGRYCFDISVPTGIKSTSSSGTDSERTSNGNSVKQRADAKELCQRVISFAWIKQTYSIRKKIGEAYKEKRKPEWDYKTADDFLRLFYGVCNDIDIIRNHEKVPLADIVYRRKSFYESDFKMKWLIYAKISKFAEYKADRKYQYITVNASSNKSANKAVLRIETEDFNKLCKRDNIALDMIGADVSFDNMMLAGYVRHDSYKNDVSGEVNHWITLLKGFIVRVSEQGMYLQSENTSEKELLELLCRNHIVFTRPMMPLESYGGIIPALVIERKNQKDLIVDIAISSHDLATKTDYKENCSEYEVLIFPKGTCADEMYTEIAGYIS